MSETAFIFAQRVSRLKPSMIRELMKLMGRPGLVSLGGGLPSAASFPAEALRATAQRVLSQTPAKHFSTLQRKGCPRCASGSRSACVNAA